MPFTSFDLTPPPGTMTSSSPTITNSPTKPKRVYQRRSTERRKEQNKIASRVHRQKKEAYRQELEARLEALTSGSNGGDGGGGSSRSPFSAENQMLLERIRQLEVENGNMMQMLGMQQHQHQHHHLQHQAQGHMDHVMKINSEMGSLGCAGGSVAADTSLFGHPSGYENQLEQGSGLVKWGDFHHHQQADWSFGGAEQGISDQSDDDTFTLTTSRASSSDPTQPKPKRAYRRFDKEKRKEQNKVASKLHRQKKTAYKQELEMKLESLLSKEGGNSVENEQLKVRIQQLEAENYNLLQLQKLTVDSTPSMPVIPNTRPQHLVYDNPPPIIVVSPVQDEPKLKHKT
ncbi:hypothetical protein HDU79_011658 [Rhizoclosmatium sp. JEL0117]|nr:hypothetical protein HDU79_011658 [Rhizoclosmatium sp. JEL0117]